MIRRLYIDNYKALVNCDIVLERLSLLCGENGAGKSSVFEVLQGVADLVTEAVPVSELFGPRTRTKWMKGGVQTVRLEVEDGHGQGKYEYGLVIEHTEDSRAIRVAEETLAFNGTTLFRGSSGKVRLHNDKGQPGPELSFDPGKTGVSLVFASDSNRRLTRFKELLSKIAWVQPNPFAMEPESRAEAIRLTRGLDNFVSWFRRTAQDYGLAYDIIGQWREILPGLRPFRLDEYGAETRRLVLPIQDESGQPGDFGLDDLSEGQRTLLALYAVLAVWNRDGGTLLLDEPDNFVGLPEIQPLLGAIRDASEADSGLQILIVSHNLEFVNSLAGAHGLRMRREGQGHVRVGEVSVEGQYPADALARMEG